MFMLTFEVNVLANQGVGAREEHYFDEEITFPEEENLKTLCPLTGEVELMMLDHEINVQLKDVQIDVETTCNRCGKSFELHVEIPFAERQFLINVPDTQIDLDEDSFMVDRKYWKISILEMVRQEILLHFPPIPVCSESCKGLCDQCGINLNYKACEHVETD
jgi:uncharacterized protein